MPRKSEIYNQSVYFPKGEFIYYAAGCFVQGNGSFVCFALGDRPYHFFLIISATNDGNGHAFVHISLIRHCFPLIIEIIFIAANFILTQVLGEKVEQRGWINYFPRKRKRNDFFIGMTGILKTAL